MAEDTTTRAELEAKIGQFNTNRMLCGVAETARDWPFLDKMNAEHKELIDWLATYGITFNDLGYDSETSTFFIPAAILAMASQ